MQKTLLILLFISSTITSCLSQTNHSRIYGTVFVDTNISMPQTEVNISEWMGFIACKNFDSTLFPDENVISPSVKILFNDLKKKSNFKYLKVVEAKGSLKRYWGDKGISYNRNIKDLQALDDNYLSLLLLPITGISFNQASRFCLWKEETLNSNQPENKKVKISLPSIELYSTLITNIDSFNSKNVDSCKRHTFNYRMPKSNCKNKDKSISKQEQGLVRADSYLPNKDAIYCLQGNAAEMTSTEGIAMGGSFRHWARQSYNDQRQEYKEPEDWLGFRYIVTYK